MKSYQRGTFYSVGYLDENGSIVLFNEKSSIIDRRNAQGAVISAQAAYPDKKAILLVSTSEGHPYKWDVWDNHEQTKIDLIARSFQRYDLNELYGLKLLQEQDRDSLTSFVNNIRNSNVEVKLNPDARYEERIADCQAHIDAFQMIIDEKEEFINHVVQYGYTD